MQSYTEKAISTPMCFKLQPHIKLWIWIKISKMNCKQRISFDLHKSQTIFAPASLFQLSSLSYPPSLKRSSSPFDQTTRARRQLFPRNSVTLPSSTLDWLQPLSLIFLQAVTIHCLWHSPVGSLTPVNQINFIFLSMPCNWMSQMGRDVTWFKMSIPGNSFICSFCKTWKAGTMLFFFKDA